MTPAAPFAPPAVRSTPPRAGRWRTCLRVLVARLLVARLLVARLLVVRLLVVRLLVVRLLVGVLIVCAAAGLAAPGAHAQERPRPFSTLEVAASGTADVGKTLFHTYWRPGAGGEFTVTTPFYAGTAEAGASLHGYEARADVPRFAALGVFAGWGYEVRPAAWLGWYGGVRVGNLRMSFDDDTFVGARNESELLAALHARVDVEPVRGWTLFASVTAQQVFTYIRMRPVLVGAGVRYRMDTPGWLEAFLR